MSDPPRVDREDFEDWSHPGRRLSQPARRVTVSWWRVLLVVLLVALIWWAAWHLGHMLIEAYRTVSEADKS